jgi:hypothetical protein
LKGAVAAGFGAGSLASLVGSPRAAAARRRDHEEPEAATGSAVSEAASAPRNCYSYTIRPGTPEATEVYVIRSGNPGPTAFVVGGIHGNEPSGYLAVTHVRRWWDVEEGTLVLLPRANEVAIEQGTREYDEGDLNRKFPPGSEPTTALAREIWDAVCRHDPDVVVDAHSSRGIYGADLEACPPGVGQSIHPTPGPIPQARASETIERLNEQYVPDSLPEAYDFVLGPVHDGTYGPLLLDKVSADLGTPGFILEVTRCGLDLDSQQIPWTRFMIRDLLRQYGLSRIELPEAGQCDPLPPLSTGRLARNQPTPDTWYQYDAPVQPDRVVVAKPLSYRGVQPCHLRLRNVTAGDFRFKLEEWAYLDGCHVRENASFLAVEPGNRTLQLDDGRIYRLGAGRAPASSAFSAVPYRRQFPARPVVLTQPQTYNGLDPVVTRVRNVSTTAFGVRLQEEEAKGAHTRETVGYIALQRARGAIDGTKFEVRRLPEAVTHQWWTVDFLRSYDSPRFVADLQTFEGHNTAQLRYRNLCPDSVEIKVEEEQSSDAETAHLPESVGYAVFEG